MVSGLGRGKDAGRSDCCLKVYRRVWNGRAFTANLVSAALDRALYLSLPLSPPVPRLLANRHGRDSDFVVTWQVSLLHPRHPVLPLRLPLADSSATFAPSLLRRPLLFGLPFAVAGVAVCVWRRTAGFVLSLAEPHRVGKSL